MDPRKHRTKGVAEGVASLLAENGPVVHLLAAEHRAFRIAQIDDENAFLRQKHMIQVDLAVEPVRNQDVDQLGCADPLDPGAGRQ